MVYRVDPTSPNRQSQHPHFKQSSCQYKSKAFNRNRSVMRLQQPAHSRTPLQLLRLLLLPFALTLPLKSGVVFWFDKTVLDEEEKKTKRMKRSGSRIKGIENKNDGLSQLFCRSFAFYTRIFFQKSITALQMVNHVISAFLCRKLYWTAILAFSMQLTWLMIFKHVALKRSILYLLKEISFYFLIRISNQSY